MDLDGAFIAYSYIVSVLVQFDSCDWDECDDSEWMGCIN
jgi:hypothetical protein